MWATWKRRRELKVASVTTKLSFEWRRLIVFHFTLLFSHPGQGIRRKKSQPKCRLFQAVSRSIILILSKAVYYLENKPKKWTLVVNVILIGHKKCLLFLLAFFTPAIKIFKWRKNLRIWTELLSALGWMKSTGLCETQKRLHLDLPTGWILTNFPLTSVHTQRRHFRRRWKLFNMKKGPAFSHCMTFATVHLSKWHRIWRHMLLAHFDFEKFRNFPRGCNCFQPAG